MSSENQNTDADFPQDEDMSQIPTNTREEVPGIPKKLLVTRYGRPINPNSLSYDKVFKELMKEAGKHRVSIATNLSKKRVRDSNAPTPQDNVSADDQWQRPKKTSNISRANFILQEEMFPALPETNRFAPLQSRFPRDGQHDSRTNPSTSKDTDATSAAMMQTTSDDRQQTSHDNSVSQDELIKETGNANIVVRQLDLSSLQSVREFAKQINNEEKSLDVLVHNAGTAETFSKKVSEDGLELTMATNHYGPFLLTHLLIDLLKQSAPSRIVVVASELYRLSTLNLENPNPIDTFPAYLYYVSKYANIVFTLELARRLEGTNVTVNCLHPGMIDSGIWRSVPAPLSWGLSVIIKSFFKSPEQGAQTSIYLSVSDEVAGVSGKYFLDCHESWLSSGVSDAAKGKKFWELSEGLVKLQPSDPKI